MLSPFTEVVSKVFIELEPIFNNIGEKLDFDYELDLSDIDLYTYYPFAQPVRVKGSVFNKAGVVQLKADTTFTYSAPCDRCAQHTTKDLSIPVDHVLVTSLNDEENDELILVESLRFNLDELVTEDILLGLPTRHLCKEDCKGVCQYCGKNLNDDSCNCSAPLDPRLAALQQLLSNNDE